jgi:hypothetical protein
MGFTEGHTEVCSTHRVTELQIGFSNRTKSEINGKRVSRLTLETEKYVNIPALYATVQISAAIMN